MELLVDKVTFIKGGLTGIGPSCVCVEMLNKVDTLVQRKGVGIMTRIPLCAA